MADAKHLKILKQGVDTWNHWRQQNPKTRPNLQDADLRDGDFPGVNLAKANLTGANLAGANLAQANLSQTNFASFASLSKANLCEANLREAHLAGTSLVLAKLVRADLSGANLSGADLSLADLSEAKLVEADLKAVNLSGATLNGANLSGVNFAGEFLQRKLKLTGVKYDSKTVWPANFQPPQMPQAPKFFPTTSPKLSGTNLQHPDSSKELAAVSQPQPGQFPAAAAKTGSTRPAKMIFVSYSRRDSPTVDQLVSRIESAGFQVWIDRGRMRAGDQWRRQIVEAITSCDLFIIVLSPNSVKSKNVLKELNLADSKDKPVLPVVIQETVTPPEMDYQLTGIQWIDLKTDFEQGMANLLSTVREFVKK